MFVVGPQDPEHPQESGDTPHDHVMNFIPYGQRATCHAWKVVANDGPFTGRVHVRLSGLAYEVELGEGIVPLVSRQVVTDALVQGLAASRSRPSGSRTSSAGPLANPDRTSRSGASAQRPPRSRRLYPPYRDAATVESRLPEG